MQINSINNKENLDFKLQNFVPYQVSVFHNDISSSVSQVYIKSHNLSKLEWRALANLWPNKTLLAKNIATLSSMDKVSVCRAVAKLTERELIIQEKSPEDGRIVLLSLTEKGKVVCDDIINKIKTVETKLLNGVSVQELEQLRSIMKKIRRNT